MKSANINFTEGEAKDIAVLIDIAVKSKGIEITKVAEYYLTKFENAAFAEAPVAPTLPETPATPVKLDQEA